MMSERRSRLPFVSSSLASASRFFELVLRDPRGFLDQPPPVLGLGREDLVDAALLDDRVGAHAEARCREAGPGCLQADLLVVQEVLALAVAVDAAARRAASALRVAASRVSPLEADERQDDLGHAERAALGGAVEDDVVHPLAAQDPRALLAQGPGHGVADVRLAAAVGADDRGDGAREGQIHLLVEGLEARDLDPFESEHLLRNVANATAGCHN